MTLPPHNPDLLYLHLRSTSRDTNWTDICRSDCGDRQHSGSSGNGSCVPCGITIRVDTCPCFVFAQADTHLARIFWRQ